MSDRERAGKRERERQESGVREGEGKEKERKEEWGKEGEKGSHFIRRSSSSSEDQPQEVTSHGRP